MAHLNKLERQTERVEGLEKLTALRGYGKINTLQAKAVQFVTDHQRMLEEIIKEREQQ
jgi:hypothetical protein